MTEAFNSYISNKSMHQLVATLITIGSADTMAAGMDVIEEGDEEEDQDPSSRGQDEVDGEDEVDGADEVDGEDTLYGGGSEASTEAMIESLYYLAKNGLLSKHDSQLLFDLATMPTSSMSPGQRSLSRRLMAAAIALEVDNNIEEFADTLQRVAQLCKDLMAQEADQDKDQTHQMMLAMHEQLTLLLRFYEGDMLSRNETAVLSDAIERGDVRVQAAFAAHRLDEDMHELLDTLRRIVAGSYPNATASSATAAVAPTPTTRASAATSTKTPSSTPSRTTSSAAGSSLSALASPAPTAAQQRERQAAYLEMYQQSERSQRETYLAQLKELQELQSAYQAAQVALDEAKRQQAISIKREEVRARAAAMRDAADDEDDEENYDHEEEEVEDYDDEDDDECDDADEDDEDYDDDDDDGEDEEEEEEEEEDDMYQGQGSASGSPPAPFYFDLSDRDSLKTLAVRLSEEPSVSSENMMRILNMLVTGDPHLLAMLSALSEGSVDWPVVVELLNDFLQTAQPASRSSASASASASATTFSTGRASAGVSTTAIRRRAWAQEQAQAQAQSTQAAQTHQSTQSRAAHSRSNTPLDYEVESVLTAHLSLREGTP